MPKKEIRSLTGLRGLAAIYVVLFHYLPLANVSDVSNPFKRALNHGYLAVDLFFVLSGFVMAMNYRHMFASGFTQAGYLKFLGRRIARIYPLYAAATLVGFVLVAAGWLRFQEGASLGWALLFNLTMAQAWGLVSSFDSPAWSISAEWAAYLLFPALLVPTMFRRPIVGWLCALICAGVLASLYGMSTVLGHHPAHSYLLGEPLNYSSHWLGLPLLRCLPEFALGILAYRLAVTRVGLRIASSKWIAPIVCLVVLVVAALPKSDLALVLLFPPLVLSLASSAHLPGRVLASRPIEFLGTLSFSIYLVHKLLLGVLGWLVTRIHAAGFAHATTYAAAACIALTFPIAFGAYKTIEAPGRRMLRRLFEGRTTESTIRGALTST